MDRKINSIKIKCHRCGNQWRYKGDNLFYASCSTCKTSVKIKDIVTQSQPMVCQPNDKIESLSISSPNKIVAEKPCVGVC